MHSQPIGSNEIGVIPLNREVIDLQRLINPLDLAHQQIAFGNRDGVADLQMLRFNPAFTLAPEGVFFRGQDFVVVRCKSVVVGHLPVHELSDGPGGVEETLVVTCQNKIANF